MNNYDAPAKGALYDGFLVKPVLIDLRYTAQMGRQKNCMKI